MRFIADESCDFGVVRALRSAGHEVLAVAESAPGAADSTVIARAIDEQRVLLTEDKDFGRLVFASGGTAAPVLLIRYPAGARGSLADDVCAFVTTNDAALVRSFVTLTPGKARVSRFPVE
jgi:hypothetical protein